MCDFEVIFMDDFPLQIRTGEQILLKSGGEDSLV